MASNLTGQVRNIEPFCIGDGSGTACPCGNASAIGAGAGCLNSLGIGGKLVALGVASVSADSIVLTGSSMPDSSALYFQGESAVAGGLGTVFGDGLRCAGSPVVRLGTKVNVTGTSSYPVAGDLSISVKGAVPPGAMRYYQVRYRDNPAFCTVEMFNQTNGVQVTWIP